MHWTLSPLLSALTGQEITPAQLLGTVEEEQRSRLAEAEREARKLLRKMKKAGLTSGR